MAETFSSNLEQPAAINIPEQIQSLVDACKRRGIPSTPQRKAVLAAVLEMDCHPTAEEVFDHLARQKSKIGRATVFRTLDSLVDLGLISKTCHPGRGVRYDRINSRHHHLVCLRCNAMVDFIDDKLNTLPIPDTTQMGFRIADYRVQVRGLCSRCQAEQMEKPARSKTKNTRSYVEP